MRTTKDKETAMQQVSNLAKKLNAIQAGSMFLDTYGATPEHSSPQYAKVVWRYSLRLSPLFALLILANAAFAQGIIIYSAPVGNQAQLFKTDESWQKSEQLTKGVISHEYPSFSWDGRKIAFVGSDGIGRADIYWMNSDGQNIEQLTDTPEMELWPHFSSDGKQLLFTRGSDWKTALTVAIDLLTKTERVLFKGIGATYSADGQWIAFAAFDDKGNWEIYKTPADHFAPMNLSRHPATDLDPAFSPDGGWIAFASKRGGVVLDIYKMRADGTEVTRLTPVLGGELRFPIWSPSGKQILFSSNLPQRVYQMDSDGRNIEVAAQNVYSYAWFDSRFARPFAISPSGKLAVTWGLLKRAQ